MTDKAIADKNTRYCRYCGEEIIFRDNIWWHSIRDPERLEIDGHCDGNEPVEHGVAAIWDEQ